MQITLAVRALRLPVLAAGLFVGACSGSTDTPGDLSGAGSGATPSAGSTGVAAGGTASAMSGAGGENSAGQSASAGLGGGGNASGSPGAAGGLGTSGAPGGGGTSSAGTSSGGAGVGGNGGTSSAGTSGAGTSGGGPLPPTLTGLFPGVGATGVCLDAPLTMTFAATPSIGSAGKITIYASSSPTAVVDSVDVDLTTATYSDTIGGQTRNLVRPVFIDGKSAVIYFHAHKLAANTSYFVTVTSGTFVDAQKSPIGTVTGQTAWTFSTGPAPAASASMAVNRQGNGGFCTVQGAFDAIPANNTAARTISVAAGNYHEMLYLNGKKNLTLRGADRAGTVIQYPNNDKLNAGTSGRPLFFANGTTGLSIENLTIYNTTPQDGSQAEALRVQGDQVILRDSNFKSLQDTLLLSGRVYVVTSYVEGNVDFVWGSGVTYFDRSEIKTVGRAGAIVQARNGSTGYGYVFVDSKLTSGAGITGQVLARIDAGVYPYSHVAYINCQMSSAISAKAWTITPPGVQTGNLRFWEYQNTDPNGTLLSRAGRDPAAKEISASQAAMMRDKATVLAGWNPQ